VTALERSILVALRKACREGELEAAEHLMRALETLAENDDHPTSCLQQAYHVISEEFLAEDPAAVAGGGSRSSGLKH
jgi:DTW domain-containing protein YfiP